MFHRVYLWQTCVSFVTGNRNSNSYISQNWVKLAFTFKEIFMSRWLFRSSSPKSLWILCHVFTFSIKIKEMWLGNFAGLFIYLFILSCLIMFLKQALSYVSHLGECYNTFVMLWRSRNVLWKKLHLAVDQQWLIRTML